MVLKQKTADEAVDHSSAFALAAHYQTIGLDLANASLDGVRVQQEVNISHQTATASAVSMLFDKVEECHLPIDDMSLSTEVLDKHVSLLSAQLQRAKDLQVSVKKGEK